MRFGTNEQPEEGERLALSCHEEAAHAPVSRVAFKREKKLTNHYVAQEGSLGLALTHDLSLHLQMQMQK